MGYQTLHPHTLEASAEVELQEDWFQPTLPNAEGEGGHAQTPIEGETLQKQHEISTYGVDVLRPFPIRRFNLVITPLGFQFLFTEDVEVEEKFQDGMLSKMSKITDLISKLDAFADGADKTRVRKC